ncbi:MAG: HDOD domain-containing protein [Sandaracinaceae bacterium]
MSEAEYRFLFVDDDPRVLEGIENLLFDAPDEWEIDYAEGGAAALEALNTEPYDVLVTDMRMPGIDGLDVLRYAVQSRPTMTRVVLSGHVDQEVAQEAMGYVHEFLSKPCEEDMLLATLRRCAALACVPMQRVFKEAVGAVGTLPSRPETHARALQLLDEGGSLDDLAMLISGEMAICTKVLHVANTAFYSRGRSVASVTDAVRRLGASITTTLILSVETYETIDAPGWLDVDGLHHHSTEVGLLAAALSEPAHQPLALLAGLLHDVGELLIASSFPHQGQRAVNLIANGIDPGVAEQRVLGFDHAKLGAHLFRLWNLGEQAAAAIEQHHVYSGIERDPVSLSVFAADYACHHQETCELDARLTEAEREAVDRARALRSSRALERAA